MKERPILFSAPMVQAILAGRKTVKKLYAPAGTDPLSREHLAQRILHGISRINEHGCWLWGRTASHGYGTMTVAGRAVRVHRLVLALTSGKSVEDIDEACHDCPGGDNTLCVNPGHLFEGTHRDNVRDAIRKGRAKPPVAPRLLGADNPAAKLSDEGVEQIRSLLTAGFSQRHTAERFGVSQSLVSKIKLGMVRRHG